VDAKRVGESRTRATFVTVPCMASHPCFRCLKKYCECVALGRACSDSTCKCTNCRNRGDALPSGMPKDEPSAGVSADEMVEKVN
jgi:hypothetical protein